MEKIFDIDVIQTFVSGGMADGPAGFLISILLFPYVLFTYIYNILYPIIGHPQWTIFASAFLENMIFLIAFLLLFTGNLKKTFEYAYGSVFMIFVVTVIYNIIGLFYFDIPEESAFIQSAVKEGTKWLGFKNGGEVLSDQFSLIGIAQAITMIGIAVGAYQFFSGASQVEEGVYGD